MYLVWHIVYTCYLDTLSDKMKFRLVDSSSASYGPIFYNVFLTRLVMKNWKKMYFTQKNKKKNSWVRRLHHMDDPLPISF